jgi:hypothetical protein
MESTVCVSSSACKPLGVCAAEVRRKVHVAGAKLAGLGRTYELSSLRAAWGYWPRYSLDGVNCLELRVAAFSWRPEVAEASDR